jgi:hypothetical protein
MSPVARTTGALGKGEGLQCGWRGADCGERGFGVWRGQQRHWEPSRGKMTLNGGKALRTAVGWSIGRCLRRHRRRHRRCCRCLHRRRCIALFGVHLNCSVAVVLKTALQSI